MAQHPNLVAGRTAWLQARVALSETGDIVFLRSCRCERCVSWSPRGGDLRKRGVCAKTGNKTGRGGICGAFCADMGGTVEAVMHSAVIDGDIVKKGRGKEATYSIKAK